EIKLYECEVKRRRVRAGGGYEPFWKVKTVADALTDADTEFRCKDCFGEVKLVRSNKAGGAGPYAEHKSKADSEYCPAGMHFRKATDGRAARPSAHPVQ
ncbi:MAG TPA: hypothetical protein VJU82_03350, partial [Acidobacteriaceae bacterium]|nr:hypothetical protein [Acidobacteriaceae bacterium]